MVAILTTQSSDGEKSAFELVDEITTIGRRTTNDISIDGESVSSRHAQILLTSVGAVLQDLGSTNGSYVNGKLVTEDVILKNGDRINLGAYRFTFFDNSDDARQDESETTLVSALEDPGGRDMKYRPGTAAKDSVREQQILMREYIQILTRQMPFVLVFTLSAIFTALTLTYVASEKFEASAAIFFRPIEVMRLGERESTAFGSPMPSATFTVIGKTIEELLQSEIILGRVVAKLELDVERPEDYSNEPWYIYYYKLTEEYLREQADIIWSYLKFGRLVEGDATISAMLTLASNIDVEIDDSYISYITVRDKNNLRAAATVDALALELVAWLKEKEIDPLKFRKRQLTDALDEKQLEIDKFRNQLLGILADNQVSSFVHELEQGNIRISQLETSRIDVLSDIRNSESEIEAIEAKLDQQNSGDQQGRGRRIQADDFKRLNSELLVLTIGLEGAQARYKSLVDEIESLKERLAILSELDIDYKRTDGDLNTASRDHLLIKDALQEIIVREYNIDSEIAILNKATVQLEPVSPIKVYHSGLAAVMGIIVSIGLVYLLNFFNIRVLFSSAGVKGRRPRVQARKQQERKQELDHQQTTQNNPGYKSDQVDTDSR